MTEFRHAYVQSELSRVIEQDLILKSNLGIKPMHRDAKLHQHLASDLEIHTSLNYSTKMNNLAEQLISILTCVDAHNILRVYMQMPEHCELLFKK